MILNDLRILHHVFVSCYAANSGGQHVMMRKMFSSYLSKWYPFCQHTLPFDVGLKKSGFSIGFVGTFPSTPVMLELQLPPRGVQYKVVGPEPPVNSGSDPGQNGNKVNHYIIT